LAATSFLMLQDKFLNAFAGVDFSGIEIALGVGHDLMHPVKLAGVAAVVPGLADYGAVIAPQSPDDVVLAVRDKKKLLILVRGKRELPDRPYAQRLWPHEKLLHKLALLGEDLNTVIHAVANVNKPISRDMDAMNGIAELLVRWRGWIVSAGIGIIRGIAVGAPQALECALVRVVDDDSLVHVTVGDINLMGLGIHFDAGGPPENVGAQAVGRIGGRMANLHEEMPVIFEFQQMTIGRVGAADPDVIVLIHVNAMLPFWPIESFAGTAPGLQHVSLRVEYEYWRRGEAAQ